MIISNAKIIIYIHSFTRGKSELGKINEKGHFNMEQNEEDHSDVLIFYKITLYRFSHCLTKHASSWNWNRRCLKIPGRVVITDI